MYLYSWENASQSHSIVLLEDKQMAHYSIRPLNPVHVRQSDAYLILIATIFYTRNSH